MNYINFIAVLITAKRNSVRDAYFLGHFLGCYVLMASGPLNCGRDKDKMGHNDFILLCGCSLDFFNLFFFCKDLKEH